MITLSLNFNGLTGKTERASHEKKVREIVDTHLGFPGSEKLKLGVTIKDDGYSSVTFAGPEEIVAEAKRLWAEKVQPTANQLRAEVERRVTAVKKQARATVKKASTVVKAKTAAVKKVAKKTVKKAAPKKKVVVKVKAVPKKKAVAKKKKK